MVYSSPLALPLVARPTLQMTHFIHATDSFSLSRCCPTRRLPDCYFLVRGGGATRTSRENNNGTQTHGCIRWHVGLEEYGFTTEDRVVGLEVLAEDGEV